MAGLTKLFRELVVDTGIVVDPKVMSLESKRRSTAKRRAKMMRTTRGLKK